MARRYERGAYRAESADGTPIPGAQVTLWTAEEGGTQAVNLTRHDGTPIPGGIMPCDAWGLLAHGFIDLDDHSHLYAIGAVGGVIVGVARVHLDPSDTEDRVAAVEMAAAGTAARVDAVEDSRAAPNGIATLDATSRLPDSQAPRLSAVMPRAIDVMEFGARGDGTGDDAPAIQTALAAAFSAGGGTVHVPAGTFPLGSPLVIRAWTQLVAQPGTVFRREHEGTMLLNYGPGESYSGYAGHGAIRIEGGRWDARAGVQPGRGNTFSIAHANGVEITGVTFRDTCWAHAIEVNGSRRIRIRDCAFEGFSTDGDAAREISEAVQIDGAFGAAFLDAPAFDSTMCQDVVVEGCTMRTSPTNGPYGAIVGSHSSTAGLFHDDVRVVNNVIAGSLRWRVHLENWRRAVVQGNSGTAPSGEIRYDGTNPEPLALDNPPRARVRRTTTQAIISATFTPVVWDTPRRQVGGIWSATTNPERLSAPIDGWYSVGASVEWQANTTGLRYLALRHNATTIYGRQTTAGAVSPSREIRQATGAEVALNAGDYVEAIVWQEAGASLNLLAGAGATEAFMRWAGPL